VTDARINLCGAFITLEFGFITGMTRKRGHFHVLVAGNSIVAQLRARYRLRTINLVGVVKKSAGETIT
jgi:hypothetical protein